jgi:hypothetical protein
MYANTYGGDRGWWWVCDEKAWAGNGLVSEDHAAGQAARAGDAAALVLIPAHR